MRLSSIGLLISDEQGKARVTHSADGLNFYDEQETLRALALLQECCPSSTSRRRDAYGFGRVTVVNKRTEAQIRAYGYPPRSNGLGGLTMLLGHRHGLVAPSLGHLAGPQVDLHADRRLFCLVFKP